MDACQGRPGQLIRVSVLLGKKRLLRPQVWLAKIGIIPFQPSEASWKSASALYTPLRRNLRPREPLSNR